MITGKLSELSWGEEISFPSSRSGDMYSHLVGARYPCRSVAYVPRLILSELAALQGGEIKVLDPFMGSGTTALETNLKGFIAFGLEVDPYARMIGEASVKRFSEVQLSALQAFALDLENTFNRTRSLKSLVPEIPNIDHWFSEKAIEDLSKLKRVLKNYCEVNPETSNFLFAAFADIIRGVSNAERQSLKPYVSSRFEKKTGEVLTLFKKCLGKYIEGARAVSVAPNYGSGKINWLTGDATSFDTKEKFDVAITSPPYINAMDYVRCIRLESAWVGTGDSDVFTNVRASQVGEAVRGRNRSTSQAVFKVINSDHEAVLALDPSRARTLSAYFEDMSLNLQCVLKSLRSGGKYHVIVGDSVVRGVPIPTHQHIAEIAKSIGFEWASYFKYQIKDHRTSLPRNGRGGKIDFEHVVTLRKP